MYVRDADGTLETVDSLESNATLPKRVRTTGITSATCGGGWARTLERAAYLVEGSKVERWPRLIEPVGCV
jgi:hypothetical protein